MVHSEVCLNKYVVSIAPFSTPVRHDCSLFAYFRFLTFHPFFQVGPGGPADQICPYVRTPIYQIAHGVSKHRRLVDCKRYSIHIFILHMHRIHKEQPTFHVPQYENISASPVVLCSKTVSSKLRIML